MPDDLGAQGSLALPRPTRDLDQALRDIAEFGVCMVADALDPEMLARARVAIYRAAADDRRRKSEEKFPDEVEDGINQRVWNLPSRDPVFVEMAEHPIALHFVKALLGWPALLSNISGNITNPGGGTMVMHADQGYMPEPWGRIQGINCAWCLDDFTAENGATSIVPGSHRLNRAPLESEGRTPVIPMEAPAGTLIVMEGRVWHQTGINTSTNTSRAGAFAWYTLPIYLPQENWYLSLNPSVRQYASETMLELMGFKAGGFGRVNGASPY
ncbi:phytanoyl-CoA dioxygenase family protein [Zavarzinia sp. CC-PAN008]|uniref:phytanoyl-CoA dioxygenase family protein n=1 Tax=Zavarzinia sp. CC-PAN008 TaxID=3243332 RepID=UPI003F7448EE